MIVGKPGICRNVAMGCLLAVLLAFGYPDSALAAKTFKLSNQFPSTHHVSKGLLVFAEKVKEYSGGELEVQIFDAGQLYRDAEIVRAIRSGSTETGLVPVNKWSGIVPAVDIFEVPFAFKDLPSLGQFLDSGANAVLDADFSKYGVKTLFWVDYGYVQMFNSKHPITKPADLSGMTMRAFSAGDADTLKQLGAAPTIISSSELYMALQRGTVDGTTTGMPAAVSRKVIEVQKFMTLCNYSTAEFLVQANAKWWKSLDDKEREAIERASKDAEAFIRNSVAQAEDAAKAQIAAAGIQIHEMSEEERAVFVQAVLPLRDAYLKKSGESGKKLLELVDAMGR